MNKLTPKQHLIMSTLEKQNADDIEKSITQWLGEGWSMIDICIILSQILHKFQEGTNSPIKKDLLANNIIFLDEFIENFY